VLLGALLTPGTGGAGGIDHATYCWGDGSSGPTGILSDAPVGAVSTLSATPRRITAPWVAREHAVVTLHCYGLQGDVVQVLAAGVADFAYQPQFLGVQLMRLPQSVLLASGTLPASGTLDLQVTLPGLLRTDATPLYLQSYFRDTTQQRYVSTEVTLLELSSRY
jgi:hypothetical protein